jgi:superfamily II DNA or RNA helicase
MKFEVYNNKTVAVDYTPDEFEKLKKVLRIWHQERGKLSCYSLLYFKEKSFPTGFIGTAIKKLAKREVTVEIDDKRKYRAPYLSFSKRTDAKPLWDNQKEAVEAIAEHNTGTISSATGTGKSEMILETFLLRRVKTLVVVPTTSIRNQLYKDFCGSIGKKNVSVKIPKAVHSGPKPGSDYHNSADNQPKTKLGSVYLEGTSSVERPKHRLGSDYASEITDAPKVRLGSQYIDDLQPKLESEPERNYLNRKKEPGKKSAWTKSYPAWKDREQKPRKIKEYAVTIVCYQSLDSADIRFLESVECLIIDECHHAASQTIRTAALTMSNAAYRYFFSATPWKDTYLGQMLLVAAIGDNLIYDLSGEEAVERNIIAKPNYQMMNSPTPDSFLRNIRNWRNVLERGIIGNKSRNKAIVSLAEDHVDNGRNVFICVDEVSHLEILQQRFEKNGRTVLPIHSQMDQEEKEENIRKVKEGNGIISIATMAVGEGTDLVNVDCVILASGGKGSIRVLQRIGRGTRKTASKRGLLVLDFDDWFHPTLAKHSRIRKQLVLKYYGR